MLGVNYEIEIVEIEVPGANINAILIDTTAGNQK